MANKIKYGLKNVYIALQTESEGAYTYDSPVACPGAKSVSFDANGESKMALINEWFRINILGEKKDTNGVLVEVADGAEAPKFALLFEFQGDEKAIRHVLYNCSCSRPGINSATKEDAVDPQTESVTISCTPRSDGLVKSKSGDDTTSAVYTGWYQSVYVPVLTAASGSGT